MKGGKLCRSGTLPGTKRQIITTRYACAGGGMSGRIQKIVFWFAVLAGLASAGVLAYMILGATVFAFRESPNLLRGYFPAIFGIPGAIIVAFVIVVFWRLTDGPVEFEGLGFKVNGAAGQIVMWVVCFLAIAGAIKLVWPM
jgi:hypothetical protein